MCCFMFRPNGWNEKVGHNKKEKRQANLSETVIQSGQLFDRIMRKVRATVVSCGRDIVTAGTVIWGFND